MQNLWSDPNVPQQGFGLPISMGPMALPPQKPKRSSRGILAWSLVVFAGGIAVGPTAVDYASQVIDAGANVIAKRWPRLLGRYQPVASGELPQAPQRVGLGASPSAATGVPTQPVVSPTSATPAPVRPELAPQRVAVAALPPTPPPVERAERPGRAGHAKPAAKVSAPPPAPARKGSKHQDPFDTGSGAEQAAPAPKAAPSAPAPEPPSRPAASKSSDPLDNLLAGAVTDSKGKSSSKKTSKDIDAMLKDVQKGDAAPAPKAKEQTALPPLSSSDISKAMAGVKVRSNECARRLNQKGIAELNLNVAKSGRVTDVTVGGKVAGTPLADCIAKAARGATFPPNAGLRFDYKIDAR